MNDRQIRISVINFFMENNNSTFSVEDIHKFLPEIDKASLREYLNKKIKIGEIQEPTPDEFKLSNGLFENLAKRTEFKKVNYEIEEMNPICSNFMSEFIDNITQNDIYEAMNIADPKYFNDKNKVSNKYDEYLNFEFLIENNYFIKKIGTKAKIGNIGYDFSGKQKQYFILETIDFESNGESKNIVIPLFPLYIYILNHHLEIKLRQEFNLATFEYFLKHLIKKIPRISIIHSTFLGKRILSNIKNFYYDEFENSIKQEILKERNFRLEIWKEIDKKDSQLKTLGSISSFLENKYNILFNGTSNERIYREARRTMNITKDDIGLAFSIYPSKSEFQYLDKADNIIRLPFSNKLTPTSNRVVESVNALHKYDLPLFLIDSRSVIRKIWICRVIDIDEEEEQWRVQLSSYISESLNIFIFFARLLGFKK